MSDPEILPDNVLDVIASKIGARLARAVGAFPAGSVPLGWARTAKALDEAGTHGGEAPKMGDTFPVYLLDAAVLLRATDDLKELAKPSGRWHHQIKYSGQPRAYARSAPSGATPESWSIREVMESGFAERVGTHYKWAVENLVGDYKARLLTVPSYQVEAFWMIDDASGDQKIVVIDAPTRFRSLKSGAVYTSEGFLQALRSERPVTGLISP